MTTTKRKYDTLCTIIDKYEMNRGLRNTNIEDTITNLYRNGKITEQEHIGLIFDLGKYQSHILKILARSFKIRVTFDKPYANIDNINPKVFDNDIELEAKNPQQPTPSSTTPESKETDNIYDRIVAGAEIMQAGNKNT